MKVLLVDDEALARARLRTSAGRCRRSAVRWWSRAKPPPPQQALAGCAATRSIWCCSTCTCRATTGCSSRRLLRRLPQPPAVVFVTAHPQHALAAFEIEAVDYLTKPVRLERLQQALRKVQREQCRQSLAPPPDLAEKTLLIRDRGRIERVALAEVLYFRADSEIPDGAHRAGPAI